MIVKVQLRKQKLLKEPKNKKKKIKEKMFENDLVITEGNPIAIRFPGIVLNKTVRAWAS